MAKTVRIEQYGMQSTLVTNYFNKVAEEQVKKCVEKLANELIKQDYIPFNPEVYIKNGGQSGMNADLASIGIKVDAIYIGPEEKYLLVLLKRVVGNRIADAKYKFRRLFRKDV